MAVVNMMAENRDIWQDYNNRQEFEHDLINRKTTWWLAAQALLFAAYGVTLSVDASQDAIHFRRVVAASGVALAAITLVGVLAVIGSKLMSWREYAAFLNSEVERAKLPQPMGRGRLQWGVRTWNTWITLAPDVFQPVVLGVAWIVLL